MIETIEELQRLILNKWGVFTSLCSLINLEAKLARLSLLPLMITLLILIGALVSLWLLLTTLLTYCFWLVFQSVGFALFLTIIIHILILVILIKFLIFNLANISFVKTRAYFTTRGEQKNHEDQTAKISNQKCR